MAQQSFVSKLASESFGFLSVRGIAAWTVAGVAAYLYIVLPAQKEEKQAMIRREHARRRALEKGDLEYERRTGGHLHKD